MSELVHYLGELSVFSFSCIVDGIIRALAHVLSVIKHEVEEARSNMNLIGLDEKKTGKKTGRCLVPGSLSLSPSLVHEPWLFC